MLLGANVSTIVAICTRDSSLSKVHETWCVSRHYILLLLLQPIKWEDGFIVFVGVLEEYLHLQFEQQNSKKSKDEELAIVMEIKSLKDVVLNLQNKLECLQLDANSKDKEVKVFKVSMKAFKSQT